MTDIVQNGTICLSCCVVSLGVLKELKIQNIKNKFEAEEQAANQNYEVTIAYTFLSFNCNRKYIRVNMILILKRLIVQG